MLELSDALPPGALCAAHPDATPMPGALWWHAHPTAWDIDPGTGALGLWRAHQNGPPLEPTNPNTDNGLPGEIGDLIGLQLRDGVHCGMVAEDCVDTRRFTIALRYYVPPGVPARTLLTVFTPDNYLFLSDSAGTITAKDDANRVSATLPAPETDAPRLAIVTLDGPRLSLSLGDDTTHATASDTVLSGTGNLFVGCRNNRPRLLKTLGSALILDVWLFAVPLRDATPLHRHHLWSAT